MKILIIGSTQYKDKFQAHQELLVSQGHTVLIPAFDDFSGDELGLCLYNKRLMLEADEVHIIWDNRSIGTIFDFGMAFALNKPIKIIYIEPKTIEGVMRKYESHMQSAKSSL